MKKLLIVVIVITLPLITFFQYKNYRRFHPPVNYEYALAENVDVNYHDPSMVEEYFSKSVEISAFARKAWSNESIDVRFPDENDQTALTQAAYYNQLLARLQHIETLLSQSADLKSRGFNNEDVKLVESGVPENLAKWMAQKDQLIGLSVGSRGEEVWLLQTYLENKGLDHTVDGVFGAATQSALRQFQQNNGLYPSGAMSERTFEKLFLE
ncbi:Putative peptidoglycan binding domain-containing protein [Ekhidna lutea]|uniref:Putative peptidoglycan binding domain-containing protein n=1 Tax=Ekhidna lutea TaxID=447679 RepID=A0A239LV78_EKHLU|nr:peptidoglycan-binding domain-containing protein [Ekhidna lutea]SNT34275.1 Putative peptidoglycan binding domain-containing protein [Ekhidna lutea]